MNAVRLTLLSALLTAMLPAGVMAGAPAAADGGYRLAPEDVITVTVARHPELTTDAVVLSDGTAGLPHAGQTPVEGLTANEVAGIVTKSLSNWLVNPQVTVVVKIPHANRIYVLGNALNKPGTVEWKPGWRLTEALAEAGGLQVKPQLTQASLYREGLGTITIDLVKALVNNDPTANIAVQPGDSINVNTVPAPQVVVMGGVKNPGVYEINNMRSVGVIQALGLAGGPLPTAVLKGAVIVRAPNAAGTRAQVPVDLREALSQGKDLPDLSLQSGDTLIIPDSKARVSVYGEVKMPGQYPISEDEVTTVADCIAMAGGQNPRADLKHIGIIRGATGDSLAKMNPSQPGTGPKVIPVDLLAMLHHASTFHNVRVQSGDIIFVPETKSPDWLGKILPGLSSIGSLFYFLKLGLTTK